MMLDSSIPFLSQAAVLDKYIHSSVPDKDPETLDIIIDVLKSKPELREYFFRNGPHPAWARILWEKGFFEEPPAPIETKEGSFLVHWDVQIFLDGVADEAPDIVLKHVLNFQGQGWYAFWAVHALNRTPIQVIEQAIPRLLEWLNDPIIAPHIDDEVCDIMYKMAESGDKEGTLLLFKGLTTPVQKGKPSTPTHEFWSGGSIKIVANNLLGNSEAYHSKIQILLDLDLSRCIEILEENLRALLGLEAQLYKDSSLIISSWWRNAIETTDQDNLDRDSDKLLNALRDGLESQLAINANLVYPNITRYLKDPIRLFHRLGLYLLSIKPTSFPELISSILLESKFYSDDEIHHEFLNLLEKAFPFLPQSQQGAVLQIILNGPPQSDLSIIAQRIMDDSSADIKKQVALYIKHWIRDRLWMVKDSLPPDYRDLLNNIVTETGKPNHPTFRSWSQSYWIEQVAPLSDQELAAFSPQELSQFLRGWIPDPTQRFGPKETSFEGLGDAVGKLVSSSIDKYSAYIYDIASARANYADAILTHFADPKFEIKDWEPLLSLCEQLLEDEVIRKSADAENGNWTWVRRSIVKLLEKGLKKETPFTLLSRFRDLLLILVEDPSPTLEEDRPAEGWFGHNDPMTVALNFTRPMAVNALVDYALIRASNLKIGNSESSGPNRLEEQVQNALSKKLDPSIDPSLAVRSVLGNRTGNLFWLNKDWWISNFNSIFPDVVDNESLLFFAAAWDAFVIQPFYTSLIDYLRPKYIEAIDLVVKGKTTKPSFYSPVSSLASHLIWEYLLGGNELAKPLTLDESLLKIFFYKAPPESRGKAAALFSHVLHNHPIENKIYWPKIKTLWEWRTQEASAAGYPTDYEDEMMNFAEMLPDIPENATISVIWNLLEALLPYAALSENRNRGWSSIEKFLLMRFDGEPKRAIQYYYLLWNQRKTRPNWYRHSEDANKLITLAVENPQSRVEALRLIDYLARLGDYSFKTLYERYS